MASNIYDSGYLLDLSLEKLLQLEVSSASKYPEKISDIPASVYIISRTDIAQGGYHSLVEILRSAPGIYHVDNYDNDFLGVRGVLGTGDGDIALLINGALQITNQLKYLTLPVESIDRIEFIRGPMSIIYGNGAFLGAINIITKLHVPQRAQVTIEHVSGGLPGYRAGVRWGRYMDEGLYIANIYSDSSEGIDANYRNMMDMEQLLAIPEGAHQSTHGDLERESWGTSLVAEWQGFYGQLHFQHIEREAWLLTPSFDEGNREKTDITNLEIGYHHALSETLAINAMLRYGDIFYHREYDFIEKNLDGDRIIKSQNIESELTFLYQPSSHFDALFGFNYRLIQDSSYQLTLPALQFDEHITESNIEIYSAYFQTKFRYSNSLEIITGARIDQERSYSKTVTGNGNLPTLALGTHVVKPDKHLYVIPRAAIIYHINDTHTYKLIVGEATKGGGSIASSLEASGVREQTKTTEINYLFSNQKLLASFSLFHNESKNLSRFFQTLSDDGDFKTVATFSGKLETYGAELWAEYETTPDIKVDFSVTYAEVEDKDTTVKVGNSPELLYKIKVVYLHEAFQSMLSVRYRDPMSAVWNQVNADGSVNRIGSSINSDIVFDGNLRYTAPSHKFGLNLGVTNIFNDRVRYPAAESAPFTKGLLGPERSYYFTFNYYID